MKSAVELAARYEALAAGVHYQEDTRRFQDSAVRWGAESHPDRYRMGFPDRDQRQYATRAGVDRSRQQRCPAVYWGYDADENGVSPLEDSPPESQISALNITEKLPYTYQRR